MAFGYLDQLLIFKPNIKSLASEAYLMFCHNKTIDWVDDKFVEERKKLVDDARKSVRDIRLRYRKRKLRIEQERLKMLADKKQMTLQRKINKWQH